ncbi:MAG: chemotaxis-specific protein-glutamate methyltransferase CheB [Bdellovibrionales bacterium]
MTADRIRVLVVDDSAFARKVIREVLSRDPELDVVGIARDGLEALEKVAELRPDVITLDLLMPELDGLGVLKALPKESAPKVVVVSAAGSDSDMAMEALQNGAVEMVTKPTPLATDRLYKVSSELVFKVKTAAAAKPRLHQEEPTRRMPVFGMETDIKGSPRAPARIVVIGASTGGPRALTQLFKMLPANLPVPLAIALHIPAGYTAPLAARLSQVGAVPVQEAVDGAELKAGHAVIAPGGTHLQVEAKGKKLYAVVSYGPYDTLHRPSVDLLFESAARVVGEGALGLVMTGMGDDGLKGARAVKAAGGRIVAEAASSCVVYGMPRSVVEAGLATAQAPLEHLPELLVTWLIGNESSPTVNEPFP